MLTLALPQRGFLHARPASIVAAAAREYESVVMMSAGTGIANAKDALSLMRLGCPEDTSYELLADGPDERDAIDAVAAAVRTALEG